MRIPGADRRGEVSRIDQSGQTLGSTKRVELSKEERGRCRKENIENSISGDATSRTLEYISSSHIERGPGGWRKHGGGKTVERLWGLLRDSFVTFSSRFQQLPSYLSLFLRGLSPRSFPSFASNLLEIFFVIFYFFIVLVFFFLLNLIILMHIIWLNMVCNWVLVESNVLLK